MSGPKARCPSCGSEWDGPVVFCGECGAPIAAVNAQGDRAARNPHAPGPNPAISSASTLVSIGAPKTGAAPKPAAGKQEIPVEVSRGSRPSDEGTRRTVLGMPAAVAPAPPPVENKPAKHGGSSKKRRASAGADEAPRSESRPAMVAPEPAAAPAEKPVKAKSAPPPKAASTPPPKPPSAPPPAPPTARSSAPPTARSSTPPSTEHEETARMLEDLDAGFESIVRPSAPVVWIGGDPPTGERITSPSDRITRPEGQAAERSSEAPTEAPGEAKPSRQAAPEDKPGEDAARHEADMAVVRALFADIAVGHARPLRDFMIEITLAQARGAARLGQAEGEAEAGGEPTKEWLDIAVPATSALSSAAAAMEMPELGAALEGFAAALELASGEGSIHREVREMLLSAYGKLVDILPPAFAVEAERGRREPIIIRGLLVQVPGVHKVTIDKLYAAGLNSLEIYYSARPRDVAEASGVDLALAEAICARFQAHRREMADLVPTRDRKREREELAALTAELAAHHREHERLGSAWAGDAAAKKARARKDRADAAVKIDVLLAHLGEVDLARDLTRLPFAQKIQKLTRYLEEAKQKASPNPSRS